MQIRKKPKRKNANIQNNTEGGPGGQESKGQQSQTYCAW